MKDEIKIAINQSSFPGTYVSDAEKKTKEFGLKIGQAIQYEWFRKEGQSSKYYDRLSEFHKRRLYARGEQPISKYKNELSIDGDLSYLNLDWTPVPILPKFIDVVVNGMSDRLFKPKAYSQDAMSQAKRNKYQDMIEGQMVAKDVLDKIHKSTGVDPFSMNPEDLPSSDEELTLHMQLKYKPAIEIAEEEAIITILDENKHLDLRKRVDYDIVVLGIGVVKHEFLPGSGVNIEYVDPVNIVHSYTEDPFFKDVYYWGEVKNVPTSELLKIDPTITKEDLEEIGQYSQAWYKYQNDPRASENSTFASDTTTLLYFNYKTTSKVVYKKKILDNGNEKLIEKDDTFDPPVELMQERNFEKAEKTIDVWYHGVMVMGSNRLIKWEMEKNMVRPKSASQHAMSNYIAVAPRMYKGNIESLLRRMIPLADQIQLTHLKIQQVIQRMTPDGVFIDADGLNEVDLGNGASYNPEDALKLYFQTGSVVGRSFTQDGEFNHGRVPIKELNTNSGASKLQTLIASYNHYLDMIRAVTGLNEARDGSSPDPNSLVGIQKLAALNSNTATRHILDGSLYIFRTISEAISYRVADILEYADFKDDFANKIGKYNVSILNEIKDLYLYDFGIFIEVSPDEEERAQLEANIQMALSKSDINLEDAIDIREIKNIKLANQLLKMKRIKKQEKDQQFKMQQQAMQAQQQMQIQEMASKTALQKIDAEAKAKTMIKQAENQFDTQKLEREAELKLMLMQKEFDFNMQLAGMREDYLAKREGMKENEKKKRISQQNSEHSKLIDQRNNNLPPMNFESNEDSLDGLSLGEFEPR